MQRRTLIKLFALSPIVAAMPIELTAEPLRRKGNQLSADTTKRITQIFLEAFEAERVLAKSVTSSLSSGSDVVTFKRPHAYAKG